MVLNKLCQWQEPTGARGRYDLDPFLGDQGGEAAETTTQEEWG